MKIRVGQFLEDIAKELDIDRNLTVQDTRESVGEWDSLGHLAILSYIDKKFGIDTQCDELTRADSMGSIVAYLKTHNLLED